MTEKQWSWLTIFSFILSLVLLFLFINSSTRTYKQVGFFGALLCIAGSVFSFYFAKVTYSNVVNKNEAIILSPSVTVVGAPNEKATKLFQLHEGTKVTITESEVAGWLEIRIANGNSGWVKETVLAEI